MEEAAKTNDLKKIRELASLQPGSVNSRGVWRWTPLMRAADNDKLDACRILLEECGAHVDLYGEYGHTALHIAAVKGFEKIVKLLIKHNADVDAQDAMERTPLMLACFNGHCETARILLRHQASIDKKNKKNMTAQDMAKKGGRKEVYDLMCYVINHGRESLSRENNDCVKCACAKCEADRNNLQQAVHKLASDVTELKKEKTDNVNTITKLQKDVEELKLGSNKAPATGERDQQKKAGGAPIRPTSPTDSCNSALPHSSGSSTPQSFAESYGSVGHPVAGYAAQPYGGYYYQHPPLQQVPFVQPVFPVSGHGQFSPLQPYPCPAQGYAAPVQAHAMPAQTHPMPAQGHAMPTPGFPHHTHGPFVHSQSFPPTTGPHTGHVTQLVQSLSPQSNVPGMDYLHPEAKLTDKILRFIAEKIGNEQKSLAIELELDSSEYKLDALKTTASSAVDVTISILMNWRAERPPFESEIQKFRVLFEALQEIGRKDIIEKTVKEANKQCGH